MNKCALVLTLILSSTSFAEETEFKFDIAEFERSAQDDKDFVEFGEEEEFDFSSDDVVSEPNSDESEDQIELGGTNDIDETDLADDNIEEDLNFTPELETPKLNPNTQVISTRSGKYIYHPNQEKGLYKITRNNEYLYKFKKSPTKGFFNIKAGQVNLENFPSEGATTRFETLYDSTSITALFLEYDWEPFKKFRSLAVVAGGGISYARGRGQFVDAGAANGFPAQEAYTFMLWSSSLGLTYKFKYKQDQLFMPFINGALDYNVATEFRSSFKNFKFKGILGAHFGGGVNLNLGWLERAAALELDKEFGINNAYLTLEGRQVISFDDDTNINGFVVLAGLSFEY